MTVAAALRAELEHEGRATRAMLERLPEDRFSWRPHAKSFTLGELATHLANVPSWARGIVEQEEFDLAQAPSPIAAKETLDDLLHFFDHVLGDALAALTGVEDAALQTPWALRHGANTIFQLPRAQVLRSMILNHGLHHRGQLSVYLRLLDVPLPSVYGPTADEAAFG